MSVPVAHQIEVETFDGSLHSQREIAEMRRSVRIWQLDRQRISPSDFKKPQQDLLEIDAYYFQPGGSFFIAKESARGLIVGCIGLLREEGNIGQIQRMIVEPECHRQGIGT